MTIKNKNIFPGIVLIIVLLIAMFGMLHSEAKAQISNCPLPLAGAGTLTFAVNIPAAGTYKVWTRIKAVDSTRNSVYVQIDNGCPVNVGDSSSLTAGLWTWVDYKNGSTSTKFTQQLTAGNHRVQVIGREHLVMVDRVILLADSTCAPTGKGDNCTVIPTNTTAPTVTAIPPKVRIEKQVGSTNQPIGKDFVYSIFFSHTSDANITETVRVSDTLDSRLDLVNVTTSRGTCTKATRSFYCDVQLNGTQGELIQLTAKVNSTARVNDQIGNTTTIKAPQSGAASASVSIKVVAATTITPTNTPTATPSPTSAPDSMRLSFNVYLHGAGKGGDNTNRNAVYAAPLNPDRDITVTLSNINNQVVATPKSKLTYDPATGTFKGIVDAGSIPSGQYTMKVKIPSYLIRNLSRIFTLTRGQVNEIPPFAVVNGDVDNDNRLSGLTDWKEVLDCYEPSFGGQPRNCADPAKKARTDIFNDGKVDDKDLNIFLVEIQVQYGDEIPLPNP